MTVDVDHAYLQHLSEADRELVAAVAGRGAALSEALVDPRLELLVFGPASAVPSESSAVYAPEPPGPAGTHDPRLVAVSPFLTFAVAVHRGAARLDEVTFVEERWAPRRRVPVFDVGSLRDLLDHPARRLFLIELLASYTRVASGATWERTRRGWRRRRFSELDPVRLAGLLEAVEPAERAGIYRRLGDLALFLTGVFPDHPTVFDLGGAGTERLLRYSGLRPDRDGGAEGLQLLEELGSRWYAMASRSARRHGVPLTAGLAVVEEMGRRFADARRVLNVITDWYLFPLRDRWFGIS